MENKEFYRRAIRVGNSAGVLLPKSLLGAEVKVSVVTPPLNIKQDLMKILDHYFEEIIGIYVTGIEKRKMDILVISHSISDHIDVPNYKIDLVPLSLIKKSIKEKKPISQKILKSKPILNKKLLIDLKREFGIS